MPQKRTSLDGAYDLVILEKGSQDFLAFARHARWESAHDQPAKGTLMFLRVKFEDGMEKRVEWDELEFATENVHSVLWSYPAKNDSPLGPVADGSKNDSVGGDQLLLEDMMRHKTMLLETAPGTTTQFDLTGLAHEIAMMRSPKILKTEPVLAASQGDE